MKHLATILFLFVCFCTYAQHYNNFKVSVYCRAYEVRQMGDTNNYLKPLWNEISRQLKVDKVYLETHRDLIIVNAGYAKHRKEIF